MLSGLSFGDLMVVLVSIIISMTIHEAMHAYMAKWLGDTTATDLGRLTINPIKHVDLLTTILLPILLITFNQPPFFAAKPVPFDPSRVKFGDYGAALVGIIGPITNFLLAIMGAILLRVFFEKFSKSLINSIYIFIEVNLGFFVFNMIPIPPLDGSRLLYAFAPDSIKKIMYWIESAGFITILIIIILFFRELSPLIDNIINHLLILLLG